MTLKNKKSEFVSLRSWNSGYSDDAYKEKISIGGHLNTAENISVTAYRD